MPVLSKTGLAPSLPRKNKIEIQTKTTLVVPNIAVPAPYVLRPFAGIYNPFPYGCSVLCNHPADLEAKNVVKKAKDTWAIEGRNLSACDDFKVIKCQKFQRIQAGGVNTFGDLGIVVPEELFRRYTETDSRPLTPAPTVISLTTKHSQYLRRRRCMTPDPVPSFPNKERKFLVLDLRRSHSQETITWIGGQPGESVAKVQTSGTSRTSSVSRGTSLSSKKKTSVKNLSVTPRSGKTDSQREEKSNRSLVNKQSFDAKSLLTPDQTPELKTLAMTGAGSDAEVVKRRGKRKKGKKSGSARNGEKEFQGFPEPGETQEAGLEGEGINIDADYMSRLKFADCLVLITTNPFHLRQVLGQLQAIRAETGLGISLFKMKVSALDNESGLGSARASLTAATGLFAECADSERLGSGDEDPSRLSSKLESFLDRDILKQLQRQLDHEIVESELNTKRKIALEEALRLIPKVKPSKQNQEIKSMKKEYGSSGISPEKWMPIPRVFTRQRARFELPMDTRILNDLTPSQYAERYVFPSEERLVLYNHVFKIHMEEFDEDEGESSKRILLGKNVIRALGDIMGRAMTREEAQDFQSLIGWTDDMVIYFRMFAGISAICERLLAHRFYSKMPAPSEDVKHEVERADFESLDRKLLCVNADERLVRILKGIRDL